MITFEHRGEIFFEPIEEIRIEMSTPTSSRNMTKNHPLEKIIGSKDKGVMTRNRVNEELGLIYQVEPKILDEACKDDHWMQVMKKKIILNMLERILKFSLRLTMIAE